MSALKFVPDWFVTSKMLEKFHDALLTNDDIPFFNEDKITFNKVTFFANEIGIFSVDLDKINLMIINILINIILKLLFMSDF